MNETKSKKVSIIIPVYNVEKYLTECLDSAVGQSHQNREIIIINDGSTDSSAEIISQYKNKHADIVVITTENRGLSSARNTGLEKASGEYIIFLDSDDWIERETLESCLESIARHDVDIVFFNARPFADGVPETELEKFNYTRPQRLTNKKLLCKETFAEFMKSNNYIVTACCYMYRRDAFSRERFLPGILHEDNLFTTQLLINNESATATCLPNRFFNRRVRPGSIMAQEKGMRHVDGYFTVAEELLKSEIKDRKDTTAKALNLFMQSVINSALLAAQAAFKNKTPLVIRKKALSLFFRTNLRYISPKSALICLLPEAVLIVRTVKSILKHS